MKYIITESRIEKFAIKWLNDNYGDLERYETDEDPDYLFFVKDGQVIIDYNKKTGNTYISYDEIWSFFKSFFWLNHQQIQDITKLWVEERYNLMVTTTWSL